MDLHGFLAGMFIGRILKSKIFWIIIGVIFINKKIIPDAKHQYQYWKEKRELKTEINEVNDSIEEDTVLYEEEGNS